MGLWVGFWNRLRAGIVMSSNKLLCSSWQISPNYQQQKHQFSMLISSGGQLLTSAPGLGLTFPKQLLQIAPPTLIPTRGMKLKGRVNRRCRDCKMSYIDGILHNYCETHPRHNQKLKPKYWANERILTSVCQHPRIPWGKKYKGYLERV